jgi:pyruvate formate lyase activating enzyme
MTRGLVFRVQRYSLNDGPGIRTTVFLKGCPLSCWWCHNPESRTHEPFVHYDVTRCLGCHACLEVCPEGALSEDASGAIVRDASRCVGHGACVAICPAEARQWIGEWTTVDQLLQALERDRLYFEESGGGVTFSGGEPLHQWRFLVDALAACGGRDLHRTVDTTGFASQEVLRKVAAETDLFLYDLKLMDPELHLRATGVPLQPVLDNLFHLLHDGARVQVRIPLIPGVTSEDGVRRTADFLAGLPPVEGVRLLPYHRAAREKHRRFAVPWLLAAAEEIPASQAEGWAAIFRDVGLDAEVGANPNDGTRP